MSMMASSTNSFVVRVLKFTNDGRGLVAAGGDRRKGQLALLDGRSLDTVRTLTAHQGAITAIAFAPHNRFLATGGEDRQIRIWEWAKILNSP
jgi:WD40 repeat protein